MSAAEAVPNPLSDLMTEVGTGAPAAGIVKRALRAIRSHLGMEVAYVSEFVDGRTVFREVDAPGLEALIKVGDSHSMDDTYCRHILEGRLPQLMPDTSAEPLAMTLPITHAVPIGKHMSVPIRLPDGRLHGMFCCLGFAADRSLHERDLQMMQVFADLAAFEISRDFEAAKEAERRELRIRNAIEQNQISIVSISPFGCWSLVGLSVWNASPVSLPLQCARQTSGSLRRPMPA